MLCHASALLTFIIFLIAEPLYCSLVFLYFSYYERMDAYIGSSLKYTQNIVTHPLKGEVMGCQNNTVCLLTRLLLVGVWVVMQLFLTSVKFLG